MPTISYTGFGFRSDPRIIGCGGTMPTISYTGFGFRSDPRVIGCGGRISDLFNSAYSNPPSSRVIVRFLGLSRSGTLPTLTAVCDPTRTFEF